MLQLSWFVNKIKLLIGLIKHRAPGMGCLSAGPAQPDGLSVCRDKEMAGRVHPPKICCPRYPDLPVRGPSSCSETALLMSPLSPSYWPRKAGGGGFGPEDALGTSSVSQSCCFLFWSPASQKSQRQCTNCASTCSCVNKSSAFLLPGTGPCLLCTAFPAITSCTGESGELPALD